MTTLEKVAFLKGLVEAYAYDKDSKEGKLIAAVVDVLTDIATDLEDMNDCLVEMGAQVDEIDEDLDALESDYYEDDDCDCDCDCDCDDELYEITCPSCGATFEVDEATLLDGGIECPDCGQSLEFDIDECDCDCDDDCDCDCGCGCHDGEDEE